MEPQTVREAHEGGGVVVSNQLKDIEVWKKRYRWVAIERKTANDPNKEPNIVKVYTTEETEKGRGG